MSRRTGFHFRLDRRVPARMEAAAPVLRGCRARHGDLASWGFYVIHRGDPDLDDLSAFWASGRVVPVQPGNLDRSTEYSERYRLDALRRHSRRGAVAPVRCGLWPDSPRIYGR